MKTNTFFVFSFRLSCAGVFELSHNLYLFIVLYAILLAKNVLYFCIISVLLCKRNRMKKEMFRNKVHWLANHTKRFHCIFSIHSLWSRICMSTSFISSFFLFYKSTENLSHLSIWNTHYIHSLLKFCTSSVTVLNRIFLVVIFFCTFTAIRTNCLSLTHDNVYLNV